MWKRQTYFWMMILKRLWVTLDLQSCWIIEIHMWQQLCVAPLATLLLSTCLRDNPQRRPMCLAMVCCCWSSSQVKEPLSLAACLITMIWCFSIGYCLQLNFSFIIFVFFLPHTHSCCFFLLLHAFSSCSFLPWNSLWYQLENWHLGKMILWMLIASQLDKIGFLMMMIYYAIFLCWRIWLAFFFKILFVCVGRWRNFKPKKGLIYWSILISKLTTTH